VSFSPISKAPSVVGNRAPTLGQVDILRAQEELRQERDTFDQRKQHEARWNRLRLVMGYSAIGLLFVVAGISIYILLNGARFETSVEAAAGAALFVDILGLLVAAWKMLLSPASFPGFGPVTKMRNKDVEPAKVEVVANPGIEKATG
jgi:hypothetical protein